MLNLFLLYECTMCVYASHIDRCVISMKSLCLFRLCTKYLMHSLAWNSQMHMRMYDDADAADGGGVKCKWKFFIRYKTKFNASKQNKQNCAVCYAICIWVSLKIEQNKRQRQRQRESKRHRMTKQRIKYHKMEYIYTQFPNVYTI